MNLDNIKSMFVDRIGFYDQPYRSIRLKNCEITLDNLVSPFSFQLSMCTPYNERVDKILRKQGMGAGEVKKCWYFDEEEEVYKFVAKNNLVMI